MERLRDALAMLYARDPLPPLVPEIVAVPNAGLARWLKLGLADRLGACANIRFPFPAALVWELFRAVLPETATASGWTPEVLTWRIFAVLGAPDLPAALRCYVDCGDERARYELAVRIAATFDQYLLFRPDWVRRWGDGGETHWQAELWRRLTASNRGGHWVAWHDRVIAALAGDGASGARLPRRVALFGVPALTPAYIEVLEALAGRIDVHLFLLNPCREYWGDIESMKTGARRAGARPHAEAGNNLLASWGRMGRDFFDRLIESGGESIEDFVEPAGATLLAELQAGILNLIEPAPGTLPVIESDPSVQVHVCHGAMREVEVLHDRLLDLFDRDASLTPADVLILTPDPARYAPLVEAVFAAGDHGIPVDADAVSQDCEDTFLALLDLPEGRFEAESVLRPLETAAVRRRFDLDEDAIERARDWVMRAGIRWGEDAGEIAALGMSAAGNHTWRTGLDRLLLGYAMGGLDREERLYGESLPAAGIEGGDADGLGRFLDYLGAMSGWRRRLSASRPPAQWVRDLLGLIAEFFAAADDEEAPVQALRAAVAGFGNDTAVAGSGDAIGLAVVAADLRARLGGRRHLGPALRGRVNVCDLAAGAGLPQRVVCLLGMDNGVVPGRDPRPDFDRMRDDWRRGDRSPREEDRLRFLHAILAAREVLHVSYSGRDLRDDTELPASVLVEELLDWLDRAGTAGDGQARKRIVTEHPLQPFSRRYFEGNPRLYSHAAHYCSALTGDRTRVRGPLIVKPLAPTDDGGTVTLDQLTGFFRNPARALSRNRLGIRLEDDDTIIDAAEPFAFADFGDDELRRRLYVNYRAGIDEADALALERARGQLPAGMVGVALFERESRSVRSLLAAASAMMIARGVGPDQRPQSLPFVLALDGWRLQGQLREVWPFGLLDVRMYKERPGDLLDLWVRHLVLCALVERRQMPAPIGCASTVLWLGDKGTHFRPCAEAATLLGQLLDLHRRGLGAALPFFPRSALAYQREIGKGNGEPEAMRSALGKWSPGHGDGRGECEEPYIRLIFGEGNPLGEEFARLAGAVYGPLLDHAGAGS